jgi:hypothetical protein
MTAYAVPPYIAAWAMTQQGLDAFPPHGFKKSMSEPKTPTKAELAAAARARAKAAREAEALRANLHRRKAQARAEAAKPAQTAEEPTKCP